MGTDIVKTLSDGIDIVAKKLGVAVDKIYPILVKQAHYSLTMDIIWITVFIVSIIAMIIVNIKVWKGYVKEESVFYREEEMCCTISIISGIATILFIIFTFFCITEAVQIVVNPEWFIFNNIIKPLIK